MGLRVDGDRLYDDSTGKLLLRKDDAPEVWATTTGILARRASGKNPGAATFDARDIPEDAGEYRSLFTRVDRPFHSIPTQEPDHDHPFAVALRELVRDLQRMGPETARVLAYISDRGDEGATLDDIKRALDMEHAGAAWHLSLLLATHRVTATGAQRPASDVGGRDAFRAVEQ